MSFPLPQRVRRARLRLACLAAAFVGAGLFLLMVFCVAFFWWVPFDR